MTKSLQNHGEKNERTEASEVENLSIVAPSKLPMTLNVPRGNVKLLTDSRLSLVGRVKAPPICNSLLKRQSSSSSQLSKMCFDFEPNKSISPKRNETFANPLTSPLMPPKICNTLSNVTPDNLASWESLKRTIVSRTTSRNGREQQRYQTDPQTGQVFRLTAGCVPIMTNGLVLLVASSRKNEWILPKGGWESDETCEISALREAFEEGGVLGTLGSKLPDVEYETRKSKKRRLELEVINRKKSISADTLEIPIHPDGGSLTLFDDERFKRARENHDLPDLSLPASLENNMLTESSLLPQNLKDTSPSHSPVPNNKKECLATIIRNKISSQIRKVDRSDDAISVASVASCASSDASFSCGNIRMSMYPLYVLEVRDQWPESGRARKAVDIDTAIELMACRPEFQKILKGVKERKLHILPKIS